MLFVFSVNHHLLAIFSPFPAASSELQSSVGEFCCCYNRLLMLMSEWSVQAKPRSPSTQ